MTLESRIHDALRKPVGSQADDPDFGFDALEEDGSTKLGMSEQILAAMARETPTRCIPGVVFNEITAHRDEHGQLMRIEVDYMDEIHDPSSRRTTVAFASRCPNYRRLTRNRGIARMFDPRSPIRRLESRDMSNDRPDLVLSRCSLIIACAMAPLLTPIVAQQARAEQMSEQAKRDFMKTCIGDKKSDQNYAEHQQHSGTTAEGKCEKELQSKLK